MNTRIREILNSGGIDADSLLERCMQNEPFMIRLLQKFLLDPTYVRLATAISSADMPTAEEAAHTMKGVCGNLAMDQLFQLLEQQLAALRADDLEEGSRIMPSITHAYDAAVRAIEQLPAAGRFPGEKRATAVARRHPGTASCARAASRCRLTGNTPAATCLFPQKNAQRKGTPP